MMEDVLKGKKDIEDLKAGELKILLDEWEMKLKKHGGSKDTVINTMKKHAERLKKQKGSDEHLKIVKKWLKDNGVNI